MNKRIWAEIGVGLLLVSAGGCRCDRIGDRQPAGPRALVEVPWPGASPPEVEQELALPVEAALHKLPGLARLETRCKQGLLSVLAEGVGGQERQLAWLGAVREALADLVRDLPEDAEMPLIFTGAGPVAAVVILRAAGDPAGLQAAGRRLRAELERLPGVARVRLIGARERELVVEADPGRLKAFGLSGQDLASSLSASALDLPGGAMEAHGREMLIRITPASHPLDIGELGRMVIKAPAEGAPVRLADLATVSLGLTEPAAEVMTPDGAGLALAVYLRPGAVEGEAMDALRATLRRFHAQAPAGLGVGSLELTGRQAESVLIGRIDPPAGMSPARIADLLRPLWRATDVSSPAAGRAILIGATDMALPRFPGGRPVIFLAAGLHPAEAKASAASLKAWAAGTPDLRADFRLLTDLRRPGARVELTVCARSPGPPAAEVERRLRAQAGLEVRPDAVATRPELSIQLDRERAAVLGVSPSTVSRVIRQATTGELVREVRDGRETIAVRLKLKAAGDRAYDPQALDRLVVGLPDGTAVPLGQLARFELGTAPAEILRVDGRRCARLEIEPDPPWDEARVRALARKAAGWVDASTAVSARRL